MKTEVILWHEITKRPMTDEERIDAEERFGGPIDREDAYIYEPLPSDGEEVLVCGKYFEGVEVEVFLDDCDGVGFENYGVDEIKAWAEMPEGV